MRKKLLTILLAVAMLLIIPAAVFAEGEVSPVTPGWNADRTQYTLDDGTLAKGLFKAKMKDDVGALFYADDNGNVVKTPGTIVTVTPDKVRFLRSEDSEGHWGFREVGAIDKNAYSYLVGENGEGAIVETSKVYDTSAGKVFVQQNGTVMMTTGFADIDGLRYYVKNGVIRTNAGWLYVDGKKYKVEDGGLVRNKEGAFKVGSYRYVIPTGSDGAVCRTIGPVSASGKLYYVRAKNGRLGSYKEYKSGTKVYHVNRYGVVRVGKHKWKDNKYYFSVNKGYLRLKTGFVTRDGKRFFVKKGGLVTVSKKFKYKGKSYIANKYGVLKTGLFSWKGTLYYASAKGELASAGMVEVNGYDYYVAGGGAVMVNRVFSAKGKLYAADSNGHLQTGLFKQGNKYYFADANHAIRTSQEILKHDGKYYFNKKGGGLARNEWVDYGSKHYYAGDNAAFKTKAFTISGITFHPSNSGEISDTEYKKLFPDPAEDEGDNAEDVD